VQGIRVTEAKGFGPPEGTHRALSRRRVCRRLHAQAEDRDVVEEAALEASVDASPEAARTGRSANGRYSS